MITFQAKKVGIIASLYFCLGLIVLIGTLYITGQNKNKFTTIRTQNIETEALRQLATTIEQTLKVSERDRVLLSTFFISERETVDFITKIETLAQILSVKVETTQLAVTVPKEKIPSKLQIGFTINGTYSAVTQMISALEVLPYHQTIPTIVIKKVTENEWRGDIVLYVTLQ